MDTVYPEKLSFLHRRPIRKKMRGGDSARYRTQPVTFTEIKEVDEENIGDSETDTKNKKASHSRLENIDINKKFDEFKRLHSLRRKHKRDQPETPTNSPTEELEDPLCSLVRHNLKITEPKKASRTSV